MGEQGLSLKYVVYAKFEVDGLVDKPDVVGAVFGQTEGLFGAELDLRELQKNGRIGRIEIKLSKKQNKTLGEIMIPTSLDRVSVALIAASLESIDRVGPYKAEVKLDRIEDVREEKRKFIVKRAKEILQNWNIDSATTIENIRRELERIASGKTEVIPFGEEGIPMGPRALQDDTLILVEGRADVINLLRANVENVISIEGIKIPESVAELTKIKKEVTVLLDGDRAGDLILQELLQKGIKIDYVARAPPDKEVEDLTPKEILEALERRTPIESYKGRVELNVDILKKFASDVKDTLEGLLLNEKGEVLDRISVSQLAEKIESTENVRAVIFDGVISQRILDLALKKKIDVIVGRRMAEVARKPQNIRVYVFEELGLA
ncbi:MAG: DNA primase DnaG [Nitrososphaerota archaeon]|nr:DNA primase DnaG [Candidatus Bathyarchaeota archaeon]MCX8162258.1 DNA primase DnaG [Candidatus Bathyarchaeota archaeon]MDW8062336.1 DNA primase DnaG [Nitrososphaerota archaeon]